MNKEQAIQVLAQLIEQVNATGFFKKLSGLDTCREALKVLVTPEVKEKEKDKDLTVK